MGARVGITNKLQFRARFRTHDKQIHLRMLGGYHHA